MSFSPSQAGRSAQGGLEYKWKVLISVIFGIFMIILDSTVINVALQTLRREYDATLTSTQWIISIYVLALGIMTPLSGFLADRFGIKRMYIGGLILFVIGSILCGLAPTLTLLIAARVVQGIGGGIAQPLGPPQLYRAFPPEEQGTALGFFGVALVLAPALGPILGGLLVDANLWRWIFFINVPIGITGVILASRWLKRDDTTRKPRLDPLGMLLAVTAFGSLLFAATNAADLGWTSGTVLTWFIIGGVALIAFGVVELFVAREPLLDLRLFQRKQFAVAALVGYVTVLALFGAEFLMPVYLQALRGRTALQTGLLLLPLAISSGIVTPIAGRLYDKIGPRILVIIGFSLLIINTWQFSKIEALTPISTLMWLLALRGVALGLIVQTTFTTALSAVPRNLLPRGSSLLNGTRFVVQSIGVAVLATILSSSVSQTTKDFQQRAQETVPAAGATAFGLCETPGVPADQNIPAAARQAPPAQQVQIKASINQACHENLVGFENAYLFTFYFAIVALGIGAFLPGWPFKWAGRTAAAAEQPAASGAH
ncbi:MAG TPA: DHA2 family efflux MFS transporter permease subunit [Roseiflexaceae bacterium]|jgi:DHA2 family multidrug resistance protein|nr:DHA2 family efflux MFS transporter permease subunit [Roseiflexaceae bacterium]